MACGGRSSGNQPGEGVLINGTERFGWDQPAADAGELGTFRYALYLDGVRREAEDVSCGGAPAPAGFACTCRLPAMSAGAHTLAVAAFVIDAGTTRESPPSAALAVVRR